MIKSSGGVRNAKKELIINKVLVVSRVIRGFINLPGCFRLLFLLSFIRKTKNARLKNPTDLLHKNVMKPLGHVDQMFGRSLKVHDEVERWSPIARQTECL